MKRIFIHFLFAVLLISCNQGRKFDKARWAEQSEPGQYPNRKNMVDALINDSILKGKTYKQVTEILGKPLIAPLTFKKTDTILYPIEIEFDKKNHLLHTSSLNLTFNADTIVNKIEIIKWHK